MPRPIRTLMEEGGSFAASHGSRFRARGGERARDPASYVRPPPRDGHPLVPRRRSADDEGMAELRDIEVRRAGSTTVLPARLLRARYVRAGGPGGLQVLSSEHRTQARNLEAAHERLEAWLADALRRPRTRRPTRPSRASKQRRLDEKQRRGALKRTRRRLPEDD